MQREERKDRRRNVACNKNSNRRIWIQKSELGDKSAISKVLNYKQLLSLKMIRDFSEKLKISSEFLVQEYRHRV